MTGLGDLVSSLSQDSPSPVTLSQLNEIPQEGGTRGIVNDSTEILAKRGKKLSQILAQSWLPGGEEYRKKLLGNENTVKEFLIQQGIFDDQKDADLFDVEVKRDDKNPPYEGSISAIQQDPNPMKFKLVIPYPERPPELTDEQLEEWVNNKEPNKIIPDNLYIPQTSS